MKRINAWKLRIATYEETPKEFYNSPIILEYKNKKFMLKAGRKDQISVFKHNDEIYVVCISNLGYGGLQAFDLKTGEEIRDVFINNIEEDKLFKDAKKMFRYLYEFI